MTELSPIAERKIETSTTSARQEIIVIGLGNPILGDDGVGWRVAQAVQSTIQESVPFDHDAMKDIRIEIDFLSLGGLSLMERMVGFTQVVLIDAIVTNDNPPGTVLQFSLDEVPSGSPGHMASAHDTSLKAAVEMGRCAGVQLPEDIEIVAIESNHVYDFSEELSPSIEAAIPAARDLVMEILRTIITPKPD